MRKVDPDDVRADYEAESTDIIDHFDRVAHALTDTPNKERDITQLSTQSFLALFVAFERFLSDLFLAYLNRDFATYQNGLVLKLNQSIEHKFGQGVLQSLITIRTKAHVRLEELEGIVDPDGWNLTFATVARLKKVATDSLAPAHAARVNSIDAPEGRLIDTAHAIRNFIAHQSAGSKRRMNDLLSTVEAGVHNRHLGRGQNDVHSVGSYLKAIHSGQRRLHRYATGLLVIANHI